MLDGLRAFAKSLPGKILGIFLLIGLAGFGLENVLNSISANTIARVGNTDISVRDFQRAYQSQVNAAAQQIGSYPTPEQALALGIPSAVISRLAADTAVNDLTADMNLGVSDDRLGIMVRQDPSFGSTLGSFDRNTFVQVLAQSGFTETEYFDGQRKMARRQQFAQGIFADAAVPEVAQQMIARYSGDRRTIDYFVVSDTALPPVAEPTEEELAAYLTENQADFRTVEQRRTQLLALTPELLAETIEVSDEDVAAEYERTRANRTVPERRFIRQVNLATPELIAAFEAGQAAGTGFGQLLQANNLTATDLGFRAQAEVTDQSLAQAAFGLEPGQFSIIPGIGGQRAVAVSAIQPQSEIPLEEASDEIRQSLAVSRARNQSADVLDQIEELRAAFQPISEIASRFGLDVYEADVTAQGNELAIIPGVEAADRTRIAQAIFAAQPERLAATISLGANRNVWFDLQEVVPARDQTLDEVREQVVAAVTAQRTREALDAEVESILDALRSGTPFADVAASRNQFPQLSQPFNRNGDGSPVIDGQVAQAAFAGGEGHIGAAENGDGDQVVFQVVEIVPNATASDERTRQFVAESVRNNIYAEFVTGLRDQAGLRINQEALNQTLALNSGTGL